jgi:hypothetical protein
MRVVSILATFGRAACALGLLLLPFAAAAPAQQSPADVQASGAAAALVGALTAACRANENEFANYLTADNAAAFRTLPADQRGSFMKRFSLSDNAGRPLVSSDAQNHTVFRCVTDEQTAEFRFGAAKTSDNLAFIPVTVVDAEQTRFGLIRENGGWRLLSLGLVLLDVPQLSKEWAESDLAASEDAAVTTLHSLADAIRTYRDAYGKLPESLGQLGPAPKGQISDQQASLIDEKLAAGSVGGYRFQYRVIAAGTEPSDGAEPAQPSDPKFELVATPEIYGKSGRRSFFLDRAGKLHGADKHGQLAAADDPLITETQPTTE